VSKFAEDWAKAKADFQAATKAKKPTPTFLGLFEKGPGITTALKKADKAKTIGDMKAALKEFRSAADDYTKTLDKAIADPKITPGADKPAYAAAVKKLKGELDYLYESAVNLQPVFASNSSKNAVNPAFQKGRAEEARKKAVEDKKAKDDQEAAEKSAKEMIATYKDLAVKLDQAFKGYKSKGVEALAAKAVKQFDDAKIAKKKGDTIQADAAAGASMKFAQDASEALVSLDKAWLKDSKDLEKLLTFDTLNAKAPTVLPKDQQADWVKQYRQEWHAVETCRSEVRTYLAGLHNTVAAATLAAESAEAYRIGKSSPAIYLKRISDIQERMDAMQGPIAKRAKSNEAGPKLIESVRENRSRAHDKEGRKKNWGVVLEGNKNAMAATGVSITELKSLQQRLKAVPKDARDDKAVGDAYASTKDALEKLLALAEGSFNSDAKFIKDLENFIDTGK
jgi:hypothetical protein